MRKIFTAGIACMALFLFTPAQAQETSIETAAEQAIIVDYQTGAILFEKNADQRMPTSSMSKVITGYAVSEAIERGDISLQDTCRVSEKAWRMQGSKMFVELNSDITVEDLLRGVIIQSGNDATIVLAECLAGSEDAFANRLNEIASELGMENSNFVNASGWPDENHYSTARDLATLGIALIKDHPKEYAMYKEIDFTYHDIKQGNRNPLLYKNIGADGIKTGHTEDGGYGLMASAVRDGRRVVMVLNGMSSMQERADEATELMTWALMNFKNEQIVTKDRIIENVPVIYGKTDDVDVISTQDVYVTKASTDTAETKTELQVITPLKAPFKKGDKVGEMLITTGSGKEITVPVVAASTIEEAPFYKKLWQKFTNRS